MVGPLLVVATFGLAGASAESSAVMYAPNRDRRPIASAPAPAMNGRFFISRPVIGPHPGPAVPQFASPGPEYYGALDAADARVPVRVGHLVVSISPWERIDEPGLRRFEEARQFWLHENNFTGGVRTFVNDLHLWDPAAPALARSDVQEFRSENATVPQPRATIQLDPEAPRHRRPLRVEGAATNAATVAGGQSARISWPLSAPAPVVERSASRSYPVTAAR